MLCLTISTQECILLKICESFSPISILLSPTIRPLLNGKRAAAEIDPRPAVWIGNFEEELHELNFLWGFQWYTWPSLKVDFDSDSIEFEDILSCTGVCVKQSPLGQDLEFQTVTPTGKLDWFRVKLSLLVWISQIPGFSSDLLTQPPPPTVPLSDDCSGESPNSGFSLILQIKVEQCRNQWTSYEGTLITSQRVGCWVDSSFENWLYLDLLPDFTKRQSCKGRVVDISTQDWIGNEIEFGLWWGVWLWCDRGCARRQNISVFAQLARINVRDDLTFASQLTLRYALISKY